jgi:hypothetical protein
VRDALAVIPELAYTTLMTTLNRLATKGLLVASQRPSERAHRYRAAPRDLAGGGDISGRVTVDQQEIGTQSGDDAAPVLIDPERTGCGVTECRRPQRPGPRVYTIGVY